MTSAIITSDASSHHLPIVKFSLHSGQSY